MGSILDVYRGTEKVGCLKATGPIQGNHLVAEWVSGRLEIGDRARFSQ